MNPAGVDYGNIKEDKWYLYKGVKPPTRQSHGILEDDIDTMLKKNLADHKCSWIQQGPEIRCREGAYEHGQRIGVYKRLTGTGSGGEPLLIEI